MIVCIIGPTGVGKTRLSEELSVKYNAVIVNADSMQVYRDLNIGTAKYKPSEDLGQEHLLFDIKNPDEVYTVYDYQKDARRIIDEYKDRNIIFVGGTGLYMKAALYDYTFLDREPIDYEGYTNEELHEMLLSRGITDVHINNRRRMISKLNSSGDTKGKDVLLYDNVKFIGLTTDRENLYSILNNRVDKMLDEGLIDEVQSLYNKYGLTKSLRTGICYKEIIAYLDGLVTLDEATRILKQKNRNYAKKQYTWINYQMDVKWFNVDYEDFSNTVNEVIDYLES